MKKILVPTDFSEASANAFQVALRLNESLKGDLTLLHVYHPSADMSSPYLSLPPVELEEIKAKLMAEFKQEQLAKTNISPDDIQDHLVIGFPAEEIVNRSKDYDMVLMSTTGEGDFLSKLFGSVSSATATHANCPVLLIPQKAHFTGFNSLLYATDNKAADEVLIDQVVQWLELDLATIHFVHANEEQGKDYELEQISYEQLVRSRKPDIGFFMAQISCDDVLDGIQNYAKDNSIDLIVMGTIHRGLLEALFHKSLTRRMIFHTDTPLLIMHYDD